MLPKLHPLTKTFIDLKRCEVRIEEFISNYPEDELNDVDNYVNLLQIVRKAKELIPKQYS